ncbi:hypothetical protein CRG98_026510 [Punica granatum]|uniref:Reverse transcriptase RNase H-like domain-containing protein n=1 Tax=Punica granatum TaxID=22663 RepID=A0A2I0JA17_PUNGR|nr:hypothetical protein CRG98_026510 [Punica granatum]
MCCALVWVMQRLRQYTLYHTIRLLTKADPLKYLLGSPSSMRNIAKWRCQLTEYDIEYVPRTSVTGQAIADHLAEFPIEDDTPINSDFPDEGILQVDEEEDGTAWKMYFDGAANSTDSGIGAVLISPDGHALATLASMVSITRENLIEPLEIEIAKGPAYFDTIEATDEQPWVRHREFSPVDLVPQKVLYIAPDSRGKFAYKYDSPFVVREVFSGGAIILSDMDGTENALPVNANALKKYYP